MWILLSLPFTLTTHHLLYSPSRMEVKSLHYTFLWKLFVVWWKLVRCMLLEMIRGYFAIFNIYVYAFFPFFDRMAYIESKRLWEMGRLIEWAWGVECMQTLMIRKVQLMRFFLIHKSTLHEWTHPTIEFFLLLKLIKMKSFNSNSN